MQSTTRRTRGRREKETEEVVAHMEQEDRKETQTRQMSKIILDNTYQEKNIETEFCKQVSGGV